MQNANTLPTKRDAKYSENIIIVSQIVGLNFYWLLTGLTRVLMLHYYLIYSFQFY